MADDPTPIPVPPALRALADHDPDVVTALRDLRVDLERRSGLGERDTELIRIGTLVGMGAPRESLIAHVRRALAVGASAADVWGAVLVVAPLVGVPRLVAAVPAIAEGLDAETSA